MSEALYLTYLRWLESQIETPARKDYTPLLMQMNATAFVFAIAGDENRTADAIALREEWAAVDGRMPQLLHSERMPSVLEVLVALSRRLEFQADGQAAHWAWVLLDNLGLTSYDGPMRKVEDVDDVLLGLVSRTYSSNGQGGFFPLIDPQEDQRAVEIWYQMSAWLEEQHPEYEGGETNG